MMLYKTLSFSILILIVTCCFTTIFIDENKGLDGNVVYVRSTYSGHSDGSAEKPYNSIQYAIDISNAGDTIYIFGGNYKETLKIDKKLKIIGGVDEEETIIDGKTDKERYTVEIISNDVTFEDITVSDSTDKKTSPIGALIGVKSNNVIISGNYINHTNSYGIYLDSASSQNLVNGNTINNTKEGINIYSSNTNDIYNNKIINASFYSINIISSPNNRLYNNSITNCSQGIYAENSNNINISNNSISNSQFYGIYLNQCTGAVIKNNTIHNNSGDGIYLSSYDCKIIGNIFEYNIRGIVLNKNNCEIKNNLLINSSGVGIYAMAGSVDNTIYLNKLRKNDYNANEYGNNNWYYGGRGNYWDDYGEVDKDFDGIGDKFYRKDGVMDKYPLGYFLKPPFKPEEPDPEDGESDVGLTFTLNVKIEDPDSDLLTVYFYRADTDKQIGIDKKVKNNSIASYNFIQGFDTTFAWYAIADDGKLENRSDTWFFITKATPPDNTPPIADAGGPYSGNVGQRIKFDASDSSDPDGKIDFYRWNFGDGTSEILADQIEHVYTAPGQYEATLTVIDNNGTTDSNKIDVLIGVSPNQKPISNPGGPYYINKSELVLFDGSDSFDNDGLITNYTWTFEDGTKAYGQVVTHIFSKTGTYTVNLTVMDDFDETSTNPTTVYVKKIKNQTPGFEITVLIFAMLAILLYIKRNKKTKR